MNFTQILIDWYSIYKRDLPWRQHKEPYFIWLSEIIMQQTQIAQGLPYYIKFTAAYPTIFALAAADEETILKLWQGLGYYSRARNLHDTAKYIAYELDGVFPEDYDSLIKLKGVGDYTASAIASICYDAQTAVVDGNVYRVLSRYFGIHIPINSSIGIKYFKELAQSLLPRNNVGNYNQAIMDFGSSQCKPKLTNCKDCSLKKNCQAFQKGKVSGLPVKAKKIKKKTRYFNYLLLNSNGEVWVKKRTQKDIWQNLYEFPLIETEVLLKNNILSKNEIWNNLIQDFDYELRHISSPFRQQLTHRTIIATFLEIDLPVNFSIKKNAYIKVERKNLSRFAFPKIIDLYLKDNSLNLYSMFQDLK